MALLDINLNPDKKQLRVFGLAGAGVFALFAFLTRAGHGTGFGPGVFGLVAGLLLISAMTGRRLLGEKKPTESSRILRDHALAGIVVCLICSLILWSAGQRIGWLGLLLVGGLFALAAVAAPGNMLRVYRAAIAATLPLGFVLGNFAMAIVYFGVFTAVSLVFRIVGRDALSRNFDARAESYWVPRRKTEGAKRYFRQY